MGRRHASIPLILAVSIALGGSAATVASAGTIASTMDRSAQLRECTGTQNPFPGTRDDNPPTHTDNAYVKRVLAEERHRFKRSFPGLLALRVERRNAEVWTPDANGTLVRTGTIPDYWIVVRLRSRKDCPHGPSAGGPWFWDGVPLEFVASG